MLRLNLRILNMHWLRVFFSLLLVLHVLHVVLLLLLLLLHVEDIVLLLLAPQDLHREDYNNKVEVGGRLDPSSQLLCILSNVSITQKAQNISLWKNFWMEKILKSSDQSYVPSYRVHLICMDSPRACSVADAYFVFSILFFCFGTRLWPVNSCDSCDVVWLVCNVRSAGCEELCGPSSPTGLTRH